MSNKELCPMCHKEHGIDTIDIKAKIYKCKEDRQYYIFNSVLDCEDVEKERRLNAIYNFIEQKPFFVKFNINNRWIFHYNDLDNNDDNGAFINVADLMKDYPSNVSERLDRALLNLSKKYTLLSNSFNEDDFMQGDFRRLYCEEKSYEEIRSVFLDLMRLKYLEHILQSWGRTNFDTYRITVEGWRRIEELKKQNKTSRQAFIAMSFDPSVSNIEEAFKKAISSAGYKPQIIKDKEHNNYIMPEIFYEIKNSRFVVVDVTEPNYGAYYEAGYAQALGKEVIVCCREDVFKGKNDNVPKPHFDIAQKSTIVWKDENELIERLKNRIIATVN